MKFDTGQLAEYYRQMKTIRAFEDRIHREVSDGTVPGFVHLYAGEEACAVGVCAHLNDEDFIGSTHRGHGHCIAKGCDLEGMMKEIYGKRDGLCGGKGGSMHIADFKKGMMGANAIVGGSGPLVVGAALTSKILKNGTIAVVFMGDGALNEGAALESLNLASIWKLPMVFVVEDNGYAESTSTSHTTAGDPLIRAAAFNIKGYKVEAGHDFFEVYRAAKDAVALTRSGNGPAFIQIKVPRFYAHYEGDGGAYRSPGEVERLRQDFDCLKWFRNVVSRKMDFDLSILDDVDADVATVIDSIVSNAKESLPPDPLDLLTNVYSSV